jgi:hypothetical protein
MHGCPTSNYEIPEFLANLRPRPGTNQTKKLPLSVAALKLGLALLYFSRSTLDGNHSARSQFGAFPCLRDVDAVRQRHTHSALGK